MKTNIGKIDRWVRILIAISIAILYYTGIIIGTLAIILLIVAIAFVITGFIGVCPVYLPFGFSTKAKEAKAA